jgi:hypothetical protein
MAWPLSAEYLRRVLVIADKEKICVTLLDNSTK